MMLKKLFVKILSFFSWEDLAKVFMQAAFLLIKVWAGQVTLTKKQKMLVRVLDALNRELGVEWASETPTDVDDEFVGEVEGFAKGMAETHNFKLYTIEELK